jgi:ribonuclease T1
MKMISKKEFWLSVALAAVLACVIGYFVGQNMAKKDNAKDKENALIDNPNRRAESNKNEPKNIENKPTANNQNEIANGNIPNYVLEVYDYVIKNNKAPDGFVGGRKFENRERQLPQGNSYQEWDVKPKVQGQNRGAERLITSNKGDAYYTSDHYRTFKKFK